MKLSAVLLARVVYFVESVELNPRGAGYYPDIIKALVERYQFKGFPEKLEDYDEQKGVKLTGGKYDRGTIQNVTIFSWGLTLDTTSSTADSEKVLIEALEWGAKTLNLQYSPEMIKRKAYVSQFIFYSAASILLVNPLLSAVGTRISKEVSANLKLPYDFQPTGIKLAIDPDAQRIPVQFFTIERREGTAFSEGKYFSSAPVSTDTHISIIEQFEQAAEQRNK